MEPRLFLLFAALASLAGAGVAPVPPSPLPEPPRPPAAPCTATATSPRAHDLHVAYGNAAIEDRTVVLRLRLFKDDLEAALGRALGVSVLALDRTPEVDRIFLDYLERHLALEAEGARLEPEIVARGSDLLDREPVWWYVLEYRADAAVTELRVRNTFLFELFDDQRNVMKFVHFPDERQRTYAFARGEEEHRVSFGDP